MPDLAPVPDVKALRKTESEQRAALNATRGKLKAIRTAQLEREDATPTEDERKQIDQLGAKIEAQSALLAATGQEIAEAAEYLANEANRPVLQSGISVREAVQDDPKRGYANLGEFARDVYDAGQNFGNIRNTPKLLAAAGDGMSQGVHVDGGALIPPAFATEIWDGARQMSDSLLSYCDTVPIDDGVQSVTFNGINETSRADGSRWGGVQGYWKGELTQMTGTKPELREVKIEPQELYVFAYISDKLLRRAPAAATAILNRAAADEFNFKIGAAVWNGDGVGKPAGMLNAACVIQIAKETGQAASTIVYENIRKMYARLHMNWRAGARWFISQDAEAVLEEMVLPTGNSAFPVYMPAGGVHDNPEGRIKGLPVTPVEYASALGTVGDIVLANLGVYRVGLRAGINSAQSMHLKFDYAQTAFRFITELDGQSMLASPVTPYNGGPTLSPIVKLATRS